jgi:integrase/recombinase XerD
VTNHNADNERVKRRYLAYLKEASRYDESTLDAVTKAIHRFESDTAFRDFRKFNVEQAVAFKRRLAAEVSKRTGAKLSKATFCVTLGHLKRFILWLAGQPGYRSRIGYPDAEYFNPSEKDSRIATARRDRPAPTLEQVRHVLTTMPAGSDVELRNRALIAFTLLTGARDSAIASMRLKHVDCAAGSVYQDARDVRTKFSKSFTTHFFPVGEEVRTIFVSWVTYLTQEKLWSADDALFPATAIVAGSDKRFRAEGLTRNCWQTATPIRRIFRDAFNTAGLPYFNPHSIRRTLVQLGQTRCRTPEDFKAWSQNLGHEGVLTTLVSYGAVGATRQAEIIRSLVPTMPILNDQAKAVLLAVLRNG